MWLFSSNLDCDLGGTSPSDETELSEFVKLQKKMQDSGRFDLSAKNLNRQDERMLQEPEVILEKVESLDAEAAEVLETIRDLV